MRMIFQLFLFFLVLMILPDWYIYRNYIRKCTHKWVRRLYWLPSAALLLGMVCIFLRFEPRPHAMNTLSTFLIVFLCICVPKAVFTYVRESEELMDEVRELVRDVLCDTLDSGITEWTQMKNNVKDALSKHLYAKTKRKPMILPIIMNV